MRYKEKVLDDIENLSHQLERLKRDADNNRVTVPMVSNIVNGLINLSENIYNLIQLEPE